MLGRGRGRSQALFLSVATVSVPKQNCFCSSVESETLSSCRLQQLRAGACVLQTHIKEAQTKKKYNNKNMDNPFVVVVVVVVISAYIKCGTAFLLARALDSCSAEKVKHMKLINTA